MNDRVVFLVVFLNGVSSQEAGHHSGNNTAVMGF